MDISNVIGKDIAILLTGFWRKIFLDKKGKQVGLPQE